MLNDSKRFDRKHQKGNLTSGGSAGVPERNAVLFDTAGFRMKDILAMPAVSECMPATPLHQLAV